LADFSSFLAGNILKKNLAYMPVALPISP